MLKKGAKMQTTKIKPDWQIKFERFWSIWPARVTETGRKVKLNRVAAEQWFRTYKPDDKLFEQIMAKVEPYTKAVPAKWYQDAFRWLGKRRWLDEYGECKPAPREIVHRCFECGRHRRASEMEYVQHLGRRCKGGCQ